MPIVQEAIHIQFCKPGQKIFVGSPTGTVTAVVLNEHEMQQNVF